MAFDRMISLKYWLEDPFSIKISSLGLLELLKSTASDESTGLCVVVPGDETEIEPGEPLLLSSLDLARDLSKSEIRAAISAIIVFFGRLFLGPRGG